MCRASSGGRVRPLWVRGRAAAAFKASRCERSECSRRTLPGVGGRSGERRANQTFYFARGEHAATCEKNKKIADSDLDSHSSVSPLDDILLVVWFGGVRRLCARVRATVWVCMCVCVQTRLSPCTAGACWRIREMLLFMMHQKIGFFSPSKSNMNVATASHPVMIYTTVKSCGPSPTPNHLPFPSIRVTSFTGN